MRDEPAAPRGGLRELFSLARPSHWVKNTLVFAPMVFALRLDDPDAWLRSGAAFVAFCFLSSGIYTVNDIRDREADQRHPEKRNRPVASGAVSVSTASWLAGLLLAGGATVSGFLGSEVLAIGAAYAVLQIGYSVWWKEVVILDAMVLATGFVLRASAGAASIPVEISPWLVLCTYLLALFLAFSKRRHELVLLEQDAHEHRKSLQEYSPYFLDQMISVVTASTVVAYAIYTVSPEVREKLGAEQLYLTVPFVLFGIFRYLYLIHQRAEGGNPTALLLRDRPLWGNVALWVGTVVWLLYL